MTKLRRSGRNIAIEIPVPIGMAVVLRLEPSIVRRHAVTLLPMKAFVISKFGGPEVLEVRQVADPIPTSGQELVRARPAGSTSPTS